MQRVVYIFIFLILPLYSLELFVIADKNFPESNLTRSEIASMFLDKKRFIKEEKILVMNHKVGTLLRYCFEKNILKKTERSLERYWRKAYYQGRRPPKIVSSIEMLFLYLKSVHPAIGYSDLNITLNQEIQILYRVECEKSLKNVLLNRADGFKQ